MLIPWYTNMGAMLQMLVAFTFSNSPRGAIGRTTDTHIPCAHTPHLDPVNQNATLHVLASETPPYALLPQVLHLFEPMRGFGIPHATLVTAAIRGAGQVQWRPGGPPRCVRLAPQTLATRVDADRLGEEQQHRDV